MQRVDAMASRSFTADEWRSSEPDRPPCQKDAPITTAEKPKRRSSRDRILDVTDAAILEKGFSTTSLEEIIAAAGISRNGFFYHFRNKDELAIALITRQRERNMSLLHELFAEAETHFEDPLDVFLEFTRLLLPRLGDNRHPRPAIFVSAYAFQDHYHNKAVRDLAQRSIADRRNLIHGRLICVAEKHTLRPNIELVDLANLIMTILEGAIVITDMLDERDVTHRQLRMYREFVRYAFSATPRNMSR